MHMPLSINVLGTRCLCPYQMISFQPAEMAWITTIIYHSRSGPPIKASSTEDTTELQSRLLSGKRKAVYMMRIENCLR